MRVSLFSAAANKPCGGLKMKPFVTGIHLEQNQPQFDVVDVDLQLIIDVKNWGFFIRAILF